MYLKIHIYTLCCLFFLIGCNSPVDEFSAPGMKKMCINCKDGFALYEEICNPMLSIEEQKKDFFIIRKTIIEMLPDLYLRFTPNRVNQLMDSMNRTFSSPLSTLDFYRKTAPFLDQFACSHTHFELSSNLIDSLTRCEKFMPIPLYFTHQTVFNNDIIRSYNTGGKILTINGEKTEKRIEKLDRYIYTDLSVPAQRYCLRNKLAYLNYIAYGDEKNVSLLLFSDSVRQYGTYYSRFNAISDGVIHQQNYQNDCTIDDSLGLARLTLTSFDPDNYVSNNFDNFIRNSMELICLKQIKKMVIDLRDNAGGYDHHELTLRSFFSTDNINVVKKDKIRTLNLPLLEIAGVTFQSYNTNLGELNLKVKRQFVRAKDWGYDCITDSIFKMQPQKLQYNGEILLLVNEGTGSAAIRFAYYLRSFTNCKIAGQSPPSRATYSNGGYIVKYKLPHSKIILSVPYYYRENIGNTDLTLPNGQLKIDYHIYFSRDNFVNRVNPYDTFADTYFNN
jgi:hypothetical protein